MTVQQQIEKELDILRHRYKAEPDKRWIIEIQARALKIALEKTTPHTYEIPTKTPPPDEFTQSVLDHLL